MFDDKTIKSGKKLTEIFAILISIILLSISFFYSGIFHILNHSVFLTNLINLGISQNIFSMVLSYLIPVLEIILSAAIIFPILRKFSSIGLIIIIGFYTILSGSAFLKGVNINSYLYGFKEPLSSNIVLKGVVYLVFAVYLLNKSFKNER
jgi:uncharacterized membrane protein YphA (DoxX/SURF4 family)